MQPSMSWRAASQCICSPLSHNDAHGGVEFVDVVIGYDPLEAVPQKICLQCFSLANQFRISHYDLMQDATSQSGSTASCSLRPCLSYMCILAASSYVFSRPCDHKLLPFFLAFHCVSVLFDYGRRVWQCNC